MRSDALALVPFVESAPGEGSRFTVALPAEIVA
jgi:hypothetical protein